MIFEELVNKLLPSSDIGLGSKLLKDLLNNTSLLSEIWTMCQIRKALKKKYFAVQLFGSGSEC